MHIVTVMHTLTWLKRNRWRHCRVWYDFDSFRARFGLVVADSGATPLTTVDAVVAEWGKSVACSYTACGETHTWLKVIRKEAQVATLGCCLCMDEKHVPNGLTQKRGVVLARGKKWLSV